MRAESGPGPYLIVADHWEWKGVLERGTEHTFIFVVQGDSARHAEDTAEEQAMLDDAFLAHHFPDPAHPLRRHAAAVARAGDPAYLTNPNHPLRRQRCWAIDTVLPLHGQPIYQPPMPPVPRAKAPVPPHLPAGHTAGPGLCGHEECRSWRGDRQRQELEACWLSTGCGGVLHVLESDWGDYDFGSGQGRIYFRLKCDTCGKEHSDIPVHPTSVRPTR